MNIRDLLNTWLVNYGARIYRSMPIIYRMNVEFRADYDFLVRHVIYRNKGRMKFVQIGANDGVSREDDLYSFTKDFNIEGVMVEPQPEIFQKLSNNFSEQPRIKLVNMAIHNKFKSMKFYYLDQEFFKDKTDLPIWVKTNGIASFDKSHLLNHLNKTGYGEEVIKTTEVECVNLDELLAMAECNDADLLKIDTEGYDYEILSMLNLRKFNPAIIRFEHLHMTTQEYEEIILGLIDAKYKFIADKINTTAYRNV